MKCPVLTAWIAVAIGFLSAPSLSAGLINVNYLAQPGQRNVVEYGLYSSTGSNWVFPSDVLPISNSITVTSSEVDEAFFGATIADSLQLTLVSPPSSNYEEWVSAVFGGATPIAQRDPDDDPDNDGLENGMEYLTGSNPERPTFATVDSQSSNGEIFVVTYLRSKTVPAGVETVEFSSDLVNWEEDPEAIVSSNDWNPSQTLETVRVPLNGVDRLFARIVVNP